MANYQRKDAFYKKAKEEGYRSRAAFKLTELNDRFGFLKRNSKVVELGAWPGGWLQVAQKIVGASGLVVGIDLTTIEGFPENNVVVIQGDASDEAVQQQALAAAGGPFDLLLSDMSPKLTGIKAVDNAATGACAEIAFYAAPKLLRAGGAFVVKVFKCNEAQEFVKNIRPSFEKVLRVEPDSSRKTSNEFYVVGLGYKPN